MRQYFFFILIIFLLFFLQCTKEKSPQEIRISMGLDIDEWKVIRGDIIPLFEKRFNIKVHSVDVAPQELEGLLLSARERGEAVPLDVFSQDNMLLISLVEKDLVEDLTAYKAGLSPALIDALVKACMVDNKLYYLPYRPNVQLMYYNNQKFKQYNLVPPTSWEEWLKIARQLWHEEEKGRILLKGYASHGKMDATVTQMYEYILSAGGDPFSFNDKGFVKTFKFFQELWRYAAPESKDAKWDTSNEFLGREACYLMQNWAFGYKILYKDWGLKDNIKVYSGIKGEYGEVHVVGGDVMGIPKGAKNIELSLKFIQFIQSREVQEILVSRLGWPSVRNDAYDNVEAWMKPQFDAVNQALKHGVFRKGVAYWDQYRDLFNEAYNEIIINGKDISLLDQYAEKMKGIMKNSSQETGDRSQ